MTTSETLPKQCAAILLSNECTVILIKNGQDGYHELRTMRTPADAIEFRDILNTAMTVSSPQREAMFAGSLFGFDCPAADPENYNVDGSIRLSA